MEFAVRHRTLYRYLQDVSYSRHVLHMKPRATPTQTLSNYLLSITPAPAGCIDRLDSFGNAAAWLSVDEPHAALEIIAEGRVRVAPAPQRTPGESMPWEEVRAALETPKSEDALDAVQYIFDSGLTAYRADFPGFARASFDPGRPVLEGAIDLMGRIHAEFRYDTTVTDAATPVDRAFEIRAGVCQDLAHVGIAALRSLGLAARYVSGYLMTRPPPGQPRLLGADASHAWFAVWAPPFGWVDLDPTNNLMPGEEHITLAWGRDYRDVAPIHGVVTGGADHAIEVGVDVVPVETV
jgi:transglutaminase-like putative cysteine protease